MSAIIKIIAALIGTTLLFIFTIGLSYSISTGFAGFWGGLPFAVILAFVLSLALYDFWSAAIRKDK